MNKQVFEIMVKGNKVADVQAFVSKVKTSKMMQGVRFDVDTKDKTALLAGTFTTYKKGDACVKLCALGTQFNVEVPRWVKYYNAGRLADLKRLKKMKQKNKRKAMAVKKSPALPAPMKPNLLARIKFLFTGKF